MPNIGYAAPLQGCPLTEVAVTRKNKSPVFVYRGDAIANYGFGDDHPFGPDRHEVFHAELEEALLGDAIAYAAPRRATVDEIALFHSADYIDKVSRMS